MGQSDWKKRNLHRKEKKEFELEKLRMGKNNEVMESKNGIETTVYNYGTEFTILMPQFNVKAD